MRSGLYVCVKSHQMYPGDSTTSDVVVNILKGTVFHGLAFSMPPDPEFWKPLEIDAGQHYAIVRKEE